MTCNYVQKFIFHFCFAMNFNSQDDNFRILSMVKGAHTVGFKEIPANNILHL